MRIELNLNGKPTAWEIEPGERLADALRRHGQWSVKRGCDTGDCGACTVLLDGQPVNSCVVLAARASGRGLKTMEGLRSDPLMQRLQEAFVTAGAVQCGFCTPGMLVTLYARLREGRPLDESMIRESLSGNLCRCTGYLKPVQAVMKALEELA